MATPEITATYADLEQAIQQLDALAGRADEILKYVSDTRGGLNGEWMGFGYNKFAQEMDGEILPGMQKLGNALRTASMTVSKISTEFVTTESTGEQMVQGISAPSLL